MRNCRKSAKAGKAGSRARRGTWFAVAFCLLLGVGCSGSPHHAKGDPLVGDIHPPGNPTAPHANPNPPSHTQNPATAPVPSTTQNPGVPPIPPTTQGPVTNAALASMAGSRPLAIGNNPANSLGGQPANFVTPSGSNGSSRSGGPQVVALQKETPPSPVMTTGSFTAGQQTGDILQAQLRARGVLFQKQEAVPEGIKFYCIVPNPGNSDSSRLYEATAPDYATAVQAVLLQIDRQK